MSIDYIDWPSGCVDLGPGARGAAPLSSVNLYCIDIMLDLTV